MKFNKKYIRRMYSIDEPVLSSVYPDDGSQTDYRVLHTIQNQEIRNLQKDIAILSMKNTAWERLLPEIDKLNSKLPDIENKSDIDVISFKEWIKYLSKNRDDILLLKEELHTTDLVVALLQISADYDLTYEQTEEMLFRAFLMARNMPSEE